MNTFLEEHYNKFYEEKRLDSRHGQVEYRLTMKYVRDYLNRIRASQQDIRYQETVAERKDLLGAAAHTVDILRKPLCE